MYSALSDNDAHDFPPLTPRDIFARDRFPGRLAKLLANHLITQNEVSFLIPNGDGS